MHFPVNEEPESDAPKPAGQEKPEDEDNHRSDEQVRQTHIIYFVFQAKYNTTLLNFAPCTLHISHAVESPNTVLEL